MPNVIQSRRMKGSALTNAQADDAVGLPEINQSSHGLSAGNVVRNSASDTYVVAQADSEANVGVGLALVLSVRDTNNYTIIGRGLSGDVTLTAHGFGSFGTKLYLSAGTAGLITTTKPAAGVIVYLGYVVGTNTIHWEPGLLY